MEPNELKENIKRLEDQKKKKISEIRKLNERKRYKTYEKRALEPFVEKTKTTRVGPIKKQMRSLEYRIATQAYTPKKERDILKQLKKLETDYAQVREIERARRKLKLVSEDIEKIDVDIDKIEKKLKEIRDELTGLYKKQKLSNVAKSKGITLGKSSEEFSLLDLAEMNENKK